MPRTAIISIPTWTEKTITIPDECPHCGEDLTNLNNIRGIGYATISGGVKVLDSKLVPLCDDQVEYDHDAMSYYCGNCAEPFGEEP